MRAGVTKGHITTGDIAERLGLAPTTVCHVLAGRGDRVRIKAETQRRVLDAARELGYKPNASAKAISTGRFGSVALLQASRRAHLPSGMVMGMTLALEENGLHLSVAQIPNVASDTMHDLPKVVRELAADGLLIHQTIGIEPALVTSVRAQRIPTVWINSKQDGDCVHPDDFHSGRRAAEHLLSLGHERIAFVNLRLPSDVAQPVEHYSVADRYAGYAEAMREAGHQPRHIHLSAVPTNLEEAMHDGRVAEVEALLRNESPSERPTALIAYAMNCVVPVLIGAARAGVSIPGDLSVVMFGDGIDQVIGLPVTTFNHSTSTMGRAAAHLLLEKIRKPEQVIPPRILPADFFPGATCAAPHRQRP